MGVYAFSTVLQRGRGPVVTTSGTLGYSEASNEDEARGIAVRRAHEMKPGFDIVEVLVLEVKAGHLPDEPSA